MVKPTTYHDRLTETTVGRTFTLRQAQQIQKEYDRVPTGDPQPIWRDVRTGAVVHFNHQ